MHSISATSLSDVHALNKHLIIEINMTEITHRNENSTKSIINCNKYNLTLTKER